MPIARDGPRRPPTYHALHHAWPDAYFSSYTKLVDWVVGGGAQIAGRRFAWCGPSSPFADALRAEAKRLGGESVPSHDLAAVDVLVLVDSDAPLEAPVEAFIEATRERRLPPEVWALRARGQDPMARHYLTDVRVCLRTVVVGDPVPDAASARRAARRAVFWLRRDAHYVAAGGRPGLAERRRFRRLPPARPQGIARVRHRLEIVGG